MLTPVLTEPRSVARRPSVALWPLSPRTPSDGTPTNTCVSWVPAPPLPRPTSSHTLTPPASLPLSPGAESDAAKVYEEVSVEKTKFGSSMPSPRGRAAPPQPPLKSPLGSRGVAWNLLTTPSPSSFTTPVASANEVTPSLPHPSTTLSRLHPMLPSPMVPLRFGCRPPPASPPFPPLLLLLRLHPPTLRPAALCSKPGGSSLWTRGS